MNQQMKSSKSVRATLVLAVMSAMGAVALGAVALAAGPHPTPTTVSKETREKMAVLHEQMAACLRSDKSLVDCRAQMRKGCQQSLGVERCPMMDMGNPHPRMRRPTTDGTEKN